MDEREIIAQHGLFSRDLRFHHVKRIVSHDS